MKLFLVALLALTTLASAAFVPPAEGPVPFRRDKLPVDVDAMTGLSRQLVHLSSTMDVESPEGARSVAQILALSQALDPENRQARELAERLADGGTLPVAEASKLGLAKNRAWHLMGWLEQSEAGTDGNHLADCLADIMKLADPEHPRAAELGKKGEQGKWKGWVAEIDAYRDQAPAVVETIKPEEEIMPEPPVETEQGTPIKLSSASLRLPLWHADRVSKKMVIRPVMMKVSAKIEGQDAKLKVKLPGDDLKSMESQIATGLTSLLTARHGSLPKGLMLEFSLPEGIGYELKRNGRAFTGVVLVLADATLSGRVPEGVVYAEVDAEGNLRPPARCWKFLRTMADLQPGYRIVLPASAGNYLPPLVTLDDSEFFMTNEVILAKGVNELIGLSSSSPPEAVEAAHKAFDEIRVARGSRSLGGFLSHASTQVRLKSVTDLLPEHASAQMLALRGTPKWPKRLPREVYAREIRIAVEPIGPQFKSGGWMTLNADSLETAAEACRTRLEEVERLYGSVGDRQELHAPAMSLLKTLKGLASDAKRSSAFDSDRDKLEASFKQAWREYAGVIGLLTGAAGDREDYLIPDPQRFK